MLVKICGITREEDALVAAGCGAAMIGFVFVPSSKRAVDPAAAREIVRAVRGWQKQRADRARLTAHCSPVQERDIRFVGVFANQDPQWIREVRDVALLDFIQLHGDEPEDFLEKVGAPVIKALPVGEDSGVAGEYRQAEWLLFDTASAGRFGGSGQAFDWTRLPAMAKGRQFLLAGGLTATNVVEAVRATRPAAVDVSTGVEVAPGVKSAEKIRQFMEAVKQV